MKRQCAWCLRLMDSQGEHLTPVPLPKLYDATHGICSVCGIRWMEQATEAQDTTDISNRSSRTERVIHSFIGHVQRQVARINALK